MKWKKTKHAHIVRQGWDLELEWESFVEVQAADSCRKPSKRPPKIEQRASLGFLSAQKISLDLVFEQKQVKLSKCESFMIGSLADLL